MKEVLGQEQGQGQAGDRAQDDPKTLVKETAKKTVVKLPRYFGILCFLGILLYASVNAGRCLLALLADIYAVTPDLLQYVPSMPASSMGNDQQSNNIDEAAPFALGCFLETNLFGLNFLIFGVVYLSAFF